MPLSNKKHNSLTKMIVIVPLIAIIVTAFILIKIFIEAERNRNAIEIQQMESTLLVNAKERAKNKVDEIVDFIYANSETLIQEAQQRSKIMVDYAYAEIEKIYQKNPNAPKKQVIDLISDKLRNMRFFENLDGYFFVYDMDGTCLMHPLRPSLEGKNLLNLDHNNNDDFIYNTIERLKKEDSIDITWYWRSDKNALPQKKVGHMRRFAPLNIFVGSGRFYNEIMENTKKELQKLLNTFRYDLKGYVFAFKYDGTVVSHIRSEIIGQNHWDAKVQGRHVVRDVINGAKEEPDGFFMTYVASIDPVTGKEAQKISYIRNISEFGWVMGTGVYTQDIDEKIAQKQKLLKSELRNKISSLGFAVLIVLVIISLLLWYVFNKMRLSLKNHNYELLHKVNQSLEEKRDLHDALRLDILTGLANRIALFEHAEYLIKRARRDKSSLAVIFLDLDGFKDINDTMGHSSGDIVLKEISKKLQSGIREVDFICRFGGDEFIILLDGFETKEAILQVTQKIKEAVYMPIELEESSVNIEASMGVSLYPDHAADIDTLISYADKAMYQAKMEGKNRVVFYSE